MALIYEERKKKEKIWWMKNVENYDHTEKNKEKIFV